MKSARNLGLLLLILGTCVWQAAASERGGLERTLKVSSGAISVEVSSGAGKSKVNRGGDGQVHVAAKIRARDSWFGPSAAEKIRRIEQNPPVEQQGDTIRIGRIEDRELTQNISIDYDVTVPAQTKLTSNTGSGDQTVRGLQLPLSAKTGSGNITIENSGASVHISSGSGELKLNNIKGSVTASTGSGNIRGFGIGGEANTNAGSGDIEFEQVASGNPRVESGLGNGKLPGIKGGLLATTSAGRTHAEGQPTSDWRVGAGSGNIDPAKL